MPTDEDLLSRWSTGDRAAGDALLKRHFAGLYRFFHGKAGDETDDLIQRTFTACLGAAGQFRADATFKTYLFKIARHELFRFFRNRRRGAFDPLATSVADLVTPTPASIADARKDRRALLVALRQLPADLQLALELHYWEGLTMFELAEVMEIPPGTAKSRIRRARESLLHLLPSIMGATSPLDVTVEDLESWVREVRDKHGPS